MSFNLGNIIRSIVKPASETVNAESIQGAGKPGGKTAESPVALAGATSGKDGLEDSLQHAAQEKNDLLQQVNFLLNEVDNLSRERDSLIQERNDLGELRFRFEHERDVLQARVDQLESATGDISNGGETDRINSLMAENELLTKQRNEYGELRYRLEHEKDLYRAECNRLRTELNNALAGVEMPRIPPPLIIFQHLAKTAGTTLADILTRNLPFDQQLQILPSSNPTAIGTWPHEVVVEAVRKKTPAQLSKVRYLGGHLGFGVHHHLPGAAKYIAIFRDPVDRILSGFYYSINQQATATGETQSLEDYVFRKRHYDLGLNNYQTRVVSGLADLDPQGQMTTENARPITEADFRIATENIRQHYLLTGITERFDEFLVLLAHIMGWGLADINYTRRNITANRPEQRDIPEAIVREIEKHNEYDRRLYEFTNALLEEQIRAYGSDFPQHLLLFQQFNNIPTTAA